MSLGSAGGLGVSWGPSMAAEDLQCQPGAFNGSTPQLVQCCSSMALCSRHVCLGAPGGINVCVVLLDWMWDREAEP